MPGIKTLDSALRARARREWDIEVNRVFGEKSAAYRLVASLPVSVMSALYALEKAAKESGYAAAEDRAIDMHLRTVAGLKGQVEALGDLSRERYDEDGEPIF
jgi:hypothetical protein